MKLYSIQIIRAIAAFMVVVHHMFLFSVENGLTRIKYEFGAIGVDIFFVISGFVIFLSISNKKHSISSSIDFIKNRVMRIYPMYWIVTMLYMFHPAFMNFNMLGTSSIVKSMMLIPMHHINNWVTPFVMQGWTLYFELYFYITAGLLLIMLDGRRTVNAIGIIFLLLILLGNSIDKSNAAVSVATNPLVAEFILGLTVGKIYIRKASATNLEGVALLGASVVWLLLAKRYYLGDMDYSMMPPSTRVLAWGVPSALIVLGLLVVEMANRGMARWKSRVVLMGGDISYSVYLTHYAVFKLFSGAALMAWASGSVVGKIALMVMWIVITIVVSIVAYWFVERPLMNFVKKTSGLRTAPPVARFFT